MCLALIAFKVREDLPLVVLSNRDEFYSRKSTPAHYWKDHPQLLAGIDNEGNGTWLGITLNGKIALLTNYRDPSIVKPNTPSRGLLVKKFLTESVSAEEYTSYLKEDGALFNGFNLIFGTVENLYCYSNISRTLDKFDAGVYGLSNHFLNTPWPKVAKGRNKLSSFLGNAQLPDIQCLENILTDSQPAQIDVLPDTGVGEQIEQFLSPIFINGETYGTCASTIIVLDDQRQLTFHETTYQNAVDSGASTKFNFKISSD